MSAEPKSAAVDSITVVMFLPEPKQPDTEVLWHELGASTRLNSTERLHAEGLVRSSGDRDGFNITISATAIRVDIVVSEQPRPTETESLPLAALTGSRPISEMAGVAIDVAHRVAAKLGSLNRIGFSGTSLFEFSTVEEANEFLVAQIPWRFELPPSSLDALIQFNLRAGSRSCDLEINQVQQWQVLQAQRIRYSSKSAETSYHIFWMVRHAVDINNVANPGTRIDKGLDQFVSELGDIAMSFLGANP